MTSSYGEAKWRVRPTTNDSDDNDGDEYKNNEYEAREREAASMMPLGDAREVTLRGSRRKPAYDATNRENRVLLKRHDLL